MNKMPFKGKSALINKDKKIALDKTYNELKAKKENNEAFINGANELIKRIKNSLS